MRSTVGALTFASVVAAGAAIACLSGCSTLAEPRAVRWEDVDREGRDQESPKESAPAAVAPPAEPAAHAAAGSGPIDVDGRPVDDGALLPMPGLELACLPAADALTAPLAARTRYDETAGRLALPVGRLAFVVLVRDPARSITDPPPHLCRAIPTAAALKAPFVRVHEPARRWLVRRVAKGLVDDASALLQVSADQHLVPADRPRVLFDEAGALLAVALPVESGADHRAAPPSAPTASDAVPGGT